MVIKCDWIMPKAIYRKTKKRVYITGTLFSSPVENRTRIQSLGNSLSIPRATGLKLKKAIRNGRLSAFAPTLGESCSFAVMITLINIKKTEKIENR